MPEREKICNDLKRFFPTLVVPDIVPTERAYLLLAKLRFGVIRSDEIRSPPGFLISMRDEDIAPYLERDALHLERHRAAQEKKQQEPDAPADREATLKFLRTFREKETSV